MALGRAKVGIIQAFDNHFRCSDELWKFWGKGLNDYISFTKCVLKKELNISRGDLGWEVSSFMLPHSVMDSSLSDGFRRWGTGRLLWYSHADNFRLSD